MNDMVLLYYNSFW